VTSLEWFKEQRVIPHLLVVVPGKDPEMRIARIVEDVLANTPGLLIRTTTATRLADLGPLAEIWYQISSNKKRTEMVPRSRFYDTSQVT
jgi:hypothetical protein